MAKTMYVVQADDGMFYCGMRHWDKQLRKAKIYHSWDFADDIVSAYEECNCKIVEVSLAIVQKTNTNADRIRAMSDEELAEFLILSPEMEFDVCLLCQFGNKTPTDDRGQCLSGYGACDAESRAEAFKKWLKQPAEVEHE